MVAIWCSSAPVMREAATKAWVQGGGLRGPDRFMNDDERVRRPDSTDKNREAPAGLSQWFMNVLNQINARLDRTEEDIRELGKSTKGDVQEIKKAVDNIKKVIWIAAGVIIAMSILASFLFELGDVITKTPFEITIKNHPAP